MKCDRDTPQKFWTDMGRRAASAGFSVEAVTKGIKPELWKAKQWAEEGFAAQTARMEKRKARAA